MGLRRFPSPVFGAVKWSGVNGVPPSKRCDLMTSPPPGKTHIRNGKYTPGVIGTP